MNARMLVIAGSVVALAVPAAATARTAPIKPKASPVVVKKVPAKPSVKRAKPKAHPRVLCICIFFVGTPTPAMSQEEVEAQYDRELIEHGLEPLYGTRTMTSATTDQTGTV